MKSFYYAYGNPFSIPVTACRWYPKIAVAEPNKEYAKLLTMDLAFQKSEMTTMHQYFYQSWTIGHTYQTIRTVITRISEVETHHFNIIGQLISLLGGNPTCSAIQENKTEIWDGTMINYTKDIRELLKDNMEGEKMAAEAYHEQSLELKDPFISKMLCRLSFDEQLHYQIFKSFLSQV